MAQAFKKVDNAAEIDRLALALAKEPGSKAFIPLAEEYGKAGMWQEAAAVLEDGLKTYPNFITAMVALGRAYEQLNQPIKAKAVLEEAIKLSPDNLRAHRTLAKLYAAQGLKDAVLRSCNVILAVNPHDQEALALRAGVASDPSESSKQLMGTPASRPSPEGVTFQHAMPTSVLAHAQPEDHIDKQADHAVGSSQEIHASATRPSGSVPKPSPSAAVIRLEQWLNLIQSRRRDLTKPTQSHPESS